MTNENDNSSFGAGFALGFFLGLIGLVIALCLGESGSNIRRGAGYGFLTWIIIDVIVAIIYIMVVVGAAAY